jgi:peptidyl-prolyl cis-trans isomerase B (cyclophilin B)
MTKWLTGGVQVSPNARERAYEKRRYEEWQAKLAERKAARRRARFLAMGMAAAVAVVMVIGGTFYLATKDDGTDTGASSATPSAGATPAASATPAAVTNKACPVPDVQPPATPIQLKDVPDKGLADGKTWTMDLATTCGDITLELDGDKAPQAVSAMVALTQATFFDGTPCHRLVPSGIFVLQCGDPTGTGTGGPGFEYGPIENAPKGDLYPAGTVAMARQGNNGKSMGSQFFLVYQDSTIPSDTAGGYTILGTITKGLDVVEKVAKGGLDPNDQTQTAPAEKISIKSAKVTAG